MKAKKRKPNIAVVVTLIMLAVSIVTVSLISFAAYTNSLRAQRTVAAYDSLSDYFSSNYLLQEASENPNTNVKIVYVSSETSNPTIVFSVCNYPQGRQTMPFYEDIQYTLSVKYMKKIGDAYYDTGIDQAYIMGLDPDDDNDYTVTVSPTALSQPAVMTLSAASTGEKTWPTSGDHPLLEKDAPNSDTYLLEFNKNFVQPYANLYVKVTATPDDTRLNPICCIFDPQLRAEGEQNAWDGYFTDAGYTAPGQLPAPADYDGFNYRITGAGTGSVSLTWNTDQVDLSYVSLRDLSTISGSTVTTDSANHTKTITFNVNSSIADSYDLQFYKASGFSAASWDAMDNYVEFVYTGS